MRTTLVPTVLLLATLLAILIGCRPPNPETAQGVRLRLTTTELLPDSNFELTFDEAMIGYGDIGLTSARPVLRVEPDLPGTYVWRSRRSGLFSPSGPPALGTRYRFTLAPGLTNLEGKPVSAKLNREFESPQLVADLNVDRPWFDREMSPFPEVGATFNAPISAESLARHARFTDGKASVPVEAEELIPSMGKEGTEPSPYWALRTVSWRESFDRSRRGPTPTVHPSIPLTNAYYERGTRFILRPTQPLVSTNTWSLTIKSGLRGATDAVVLTSPADIHLGVSDAFRLASTLPISSARHGRTLRLTFSRPIDREMLTNKPINWLEIQPPVEDLQIERGYPGRILAIHGGFELGRTYTVRLHTNLICADGLPLEPSAPVTFEFEPIRPTTWLGSFDAVQLANGNRELAVLGINTPEVRLRLKRLNRHTIIHALRGYERYLRSASPFSPDSVPGAALDYAGIPGQTVLDTNLLLTTSIDVPVTRTFQWDQLIHGARTGPFFIEADLHRLPESDSPSGTRVGPQSIVQLTDLGMTVKVGKTHAFVWVFSHETARPVAGAHVTLCTDENEFLHEAVTDEGGIARLPASPRGTWVLVEKDQDLHAHSLVESTVSMFGFGIPHGSAGDAGPRLFAFTDREAYRPGETLHLRLFARTPTMGGWAFPTNPHVKLEVRGPREDVILSTNLPLSKEGGAEWLWQTPKATRGSYSFNLSAGESETSLRAEIRDFQPAAFEVLLDSPTILAPGSPVSVPVTARYLFGQPLARADVVWSAEAFDSRFEPEGWKGFSFGSDAYHHDQPDAPESPGHSSVSGKARLTEGSPLVLTPNLPLNPVEPGPQTIEVTAQVTDLNQQTIVQSTILHRDSSRFYLGFQWAEGPEAVFATNAPMRAHVVAVNRNGQPWNDPVSIEARLFRVRSRSVATVRAGRTIGYTGHTELEPAGKFSFPSHTARRVGNEWGVAPEVAGFSLPAITEPGQYQLEFRANDPDGRPVLTSVILHVAGDARLAWHDRNGIQLGMVPDKTRHRPGDSARLLLKTPFSGTAWITLEREDVRLSYVTNLIGNAPSIEVPITASNVPNAYVGVTLVRGTSGNPHQHPMPEWRLGLHELKIPDDSRTLDVRVTAPSQALLPGTEVPVSVVVTDSTAAPVAGAHLTLYAVDEGYLTLKNTGVPDPVDAFRVERPLEVATSLSLPLLLDEDPLRRQFANKGYTAGGGGRSSQTRRRFVPCPLWTTDLRTDNAGQASIHFTAPDSLTRYRIVAVATHGSEFMGSGSASIEIRKPLMIESALPRFAHLGDQLSARALVFNTTSSNLAVVVRCTPGQHARFAANTKGEARLSLAPGATEVVEFDVQFVEPGLDSWTWSVECPSGSDSVEIGLPVSHGTPAAHSIVQAEVPASGSELLRGIDPEILESPESISLRIASSPLALVGEGVRQLVHYPYGCVEQTGSSLLPWIALRYQPTLLPSGPETPTNAAVAIEAGVRRFWSMQTQSGGLAYWPGSGEPQRWGSAYAAWILTLADLAGANVDPKRLARLQAWLNQQWKQDATPYSPEVLHERCLTAFALAAGGIAEPALNESLLEQSELLSPEDRSLLAAALLDSNVPRERVSALMALPPPKPRGESRYGNSARALAIQLLAHSRIAPSGPEAQRLTRELIATQRHGHWNTTQGNAWALWALSRLSPPPMDPAGIRGEISFHGKPVPFQLSQAVPLATVEGPLSTNDASLRISHSGTSPIFVQVDVVGRPPSPTHRTAAIDRGFRIQRSMVLLDSENREQPAANLKVGDRLLVTLTIDAPEPASWVAIEDPVPAILEPIQGAFKTEGQANVPTLLNWHDDFREMRSDRMLFFRDELPEGRHQIRYLARVRAAGDALVSPCRIEAMYEPDRNGLSESTRLQAKASR